MVFTNRHTILHKTVLTNRIFGKYEILIITTGCLNLTYLYYTAWTLHNHKFASSSIHTLFVYLSFFPPSIWPCFFPSFFSYPLPFSFPHFCFQQQIVEPSVKCTVTTVANKNYLRIKRARRKRALSANKPLFMVCVRKWWFTSVLLQNGSSC